MRKPERYVCFIDMCASTCQGNRRASQESAFSSCSLCPGQTSQASDKFLLTSICSSAPIVFYAVPEARDNIIGRPEFEPIILNALLELGVVFEGRGGAAKAEHENFWRLW